MLRRCFRRCCVGAPKHESTPPPDIVRPEPPPLRHTPIHNFHVKHGAKFGEFAGWSMPITYGKNDVATEHRHVRSECGLFDVSHMRTLQFTGTHREKFIEFITPADLVEIPVGRSRLTVLTNESAGIIDDCIVTVYEDSLLVVVNAANAARDIAYIETRLNQFKWRCKMKELTDASLVALQGPKAMQVLKKVVGPEVETLWFMCNMEVPIAGVPSRIARGGYTGEDGFEIGVPRGYACAFCDELMEAGQGCVKPIGIGARDTLRLEAGMCLHGNDIDATTNLVEAGMEFCVSERRRAYGGFIGHEAFMEALARGARKVRVGLELTEKGPCPRAKNPRVEIMKDDVCIGHITSGTPAPSLGNKNIAMGYVDKEFAAPGTEILIPYGKNKFTKAQIVKMPFVKNKYYRKSAFKPQVVVPDQFGF